MSSTIRANKTNLPTRRVFYHQIQRRIIYRFTGLTVTREQRNRHAYIREKNLNFYLKLKRNE